MRSSPLTLTKTAPTSIHQLSSAGAPRPKPSGDGQAAAPRPGVAMSRWRLAVLAFAVWTLLGLCQTAQSFFFPSEDAPLSLWRALGLGFGLWYTWAALWLLAFPLARRFPLGSRHWLGRLALHAVACVGFALVKIVLDYPIIKLFYCPKPETLTFQEFWQMAFAAMFLRYVTFYWAMFGVSHALDYYGKYRERELLAAQLESGLTRARLQLLKSQLHPHFLFNTLNAISCLIHTDVEAADRMVARLGDLLRLTLEDFGLQEAPLARELEVVRSYLEIEQARLGPRLSVRLEIEGDTAEASVPTFVLQPLVENAIRHGVAPRAGPGRIDVRAWREHDCLHLEVRDDGPGLPPEPGGGVGLSNTRARLLHLYGAEQRLDVRNDPRGGCVATVTLPFHEQAGLNGDDRTSPDDSNADCG
jgi:hypothetical protein